MPLKDWFDRVKHTTAVALTCHLKTSLTKLNDKHTNFSFFI